MNNIEDKICQAIDIIVQRAISQADYDKTIQATIIKCIDQTIGKYTVRYQDSTFYAYSNNSDVSYSENTLVYVLIPSGDMSKDKTILGAVAKLGTNFISNQEEINKYEIVGNNCITNGNQEFGLQSYYPEKLVKVLYDKNSEENILNINEEVLAQYIKEANNIICTATFRTELPLEQQFNGNYGLLIALDFKDNSTEKEITREYVIDVDNMQGNPYRLITDTEQSGVFPIDNANFLRVNYITIFCYNFPHYKNKEDCIDDIWIKDIQLNAANRITEEQLNGYNISFITPRGTCFDSTYTDEDTLTVQAQVRVKNKIVDIDSQSIDFYWFVENAKVTNTSNEYYKYYNQYGGQGWKCLNESNVIAPEQENQRATLQWVPGGNVWTVAKKDIIAREVLFKCVAIYDGILISKEFKIKRLDSKWNIVIEPSGDTNFYFDNGKINLICNIRKEKYKINGNKLIVFESDWNVENFTLELDSSYIVDNGALVLSNEETTLDDYTFCWARIDQNNYFETLSDTIELNASYIEKLNEYNNLKQDIENEKVLVSESIEKLDKLKNELNQFNDITRINKNTIYNIFANSFSNFCTFKCSVYKDDIYLGTGSIVLTNQLSSEGNWNLVINDSAQIFKYNEYGVSPADPSNLKPIIIKPLSFSLYDNLGNKIDNSTIKSQDIKWTVPTVNTMLEPILDEEGTFIDNENETRTYIGFGSFAFKIASSYDIGKQRNDIILEVKYKDIYLTAMTNLIFTKQGDIGTNGSDYICRIVLNSIDNNFKLPMITKNIFNSNVKWNFELADKNIPFKVQLWHNENLIFNNTQSGTSTEGETATVKWSILKNSYTVDKKDNSVFSINEETGELTVEDFSVLNPSNIIKVEVEHNGVFYYANMPVITAIVKNDYGIELKENTGFDRVIYSSDGKQPIYDNSTPFEIIVTRIINGWVEDVSLKTSPEYIVTYNWEILGTIIEGESEEEIYKPSLFDEDNCYLNELKSNQKIFTAIDSYDGQCVNNAVQCTVEHGGEFVTKIHIPIHFMLNRYGNSAINGWDGNSVNIDKDSGFILAPQVGAGQKEEDNSFTGVLIGKVKEGLNEEENGLFGYYFGQRSIFLDAKTGTAKFGLEGAGQIIIDPSENRAWLYSGNYVEDEENGSGMLIDLTTPEIKYGNGNFSVDKDGRLIARGNGSEIGGCVIQDGVLQVPAAYITGKLSAEQIEAGSITVGSLDDDLKDLIDNTTRGIEVQYALSDSSTDPPTNGWSAVAPEWKPNKYMWQKTVTILSDGDRIESEPTCISGAQGTPGAPGTPGSPGIGVKSVEPEYYLSTSNTSQVSGSWSATPQPWVNGRYYWTRSKITYDNGNIFYTTAVLDNGLNNANALAYASDSTIAQWCYDTNRTYINGGKLYAGSVTATQIAANTITSTEIAANAITANEIAADAVTAEKINVTNLAAITANLGTVTAGTIKSPTYSYSSGSFSNSGIEIGVSSGAGYIRAKNFGIDSNGNAYFKGNLSGATGTFSGDVFANNITIKKSIYMYPYGWSDVDAVEVLSVGGVILLNEDNTYECYLGCNDKVNTVAIGTGKISSTIELGNSSSTLSMYLNSKSIYLKGNVYENGTALSSKYAASGHSHNGYASSSHTHSNYLPLSGGTMTGTLKLPNGSVSSNPTGLTVGGGHIYSTGNQQMYFQASNQSQYALRYGVLEHGSSVAWAVGPYTDGNMHLGTTSHRWNTVFAKNNTISTSDIKQKNSIMPLSLAYEQVFEQLKPVSYKFNNGDRIHTGFISQDIEQSMVNVGLTAMDWAAFCKDESENGDYIYGLRYAEIIALNTHMIQKLMKRVAQLEEQLNNKAIGGK